jgi:phosphate uptake regulator
MFVQRKLIRQGKDGFTIYLPKQWVVSKGMLPGDSVDVQEREDGILISSTKKAAATIEVDMNEQDTSRAGLELLLSHLYRLGFSSIHFKSCDDAVVRRMRAITDELLLGFEMTAHGKNWCTIENVSEPAEAKYDVLLRRIFLLIKETQTRLISDAETGRYDSAEMTQLRNQVDRYAFFCMRVNALQLRSDISVAAWEMLKELVVLEHAHSRLHEYISKQAALQPSDITLLEELRILFNEFYEAHYAKDMRRLHGVSSRRRKLVDRAEEQLEKSRGSSAVVAARIAEMARLIHTGPSVTSVLKIAAGKS